MAKKQRTPQELERIRQRKEFVKANPELDPAEARKRFYVQTRVKELKKSGVEITKERRASLRQKFVSGGVQRQGFYTPADLAKFTGGSKNNNNNNNISDSSTTKKPVAPRNITPSMRGALSDFKPGNVKASTNNVGIYKAAQNTKKNTQTYNQIVAGLTKKGFSPEEADRMAKMLPGVYERTDAKYLGSSNADKLASDVKDTLYSRSGMATFREGQETRKTNEVKGFLQEALGVGIMAVNAYALIRGGKSAFKKFNTTKYGGVPQLGPGKASVKQITGTKVVPQIEGVKPPLQLNRAPIQLGPAPTAPAPVVRARAPRATRTSGGTRSTRSTRTSGGTRSNRSTRSTRSTRTTRVTQEDVQLANYADKPVAGTTVNLGRPGQGGNPPFRQSAQPSAGKTIEWVRGSTSQAPVPQSLAEVKAVVTPKTPTTPVTSTGSRMPGQTFRNKFGSQAEFDTWMATGGKGTLQRQTFVIQQDFIKKNAEFIRNASQRSARRAAADKIAEAQRRAQIEAHNRSLPAELQPKARVPKSQDPLRQPVKRKPAAKKAPTKKLTKNKKTKAK